MSTSLGIDVGVRRGLDLVLLTEGDSIPTRTWEHVSVEALPEIFAGHRPDVVAIDSPPAWAVRGRIRESEKILRGLGIQSYATPWDRSRSNIRFYDWMRIGFRVFEAADATGYPRYRGADVRGSAIEVFPHASAVVLAGALGPGGRNKHPWRRTVLESRGIDTASLRTNDLVDAGLAALTGLHALQGEFCAPGDLDEGAIVLPIAALPNEPYQPGVPESGRRQEEGIRQMRFETKAIHVGQEPDPAYGAVAVPIYQTSTYAQPAVGEAKGYEYARTGNPTRTALQEAIAALEEGEHALCFASGMAAESALFYLLSPGDHVVLGDDVYGGTYRLLSRVLHPSQGLEFDTVDLTDLDALDKAVREQTRVVWLETPTNPLLKVVDIAEAVRIAHEAGAWVVVDNTFASPFLQRPLSLGADVVVHSSTKYLGGHSDVVGGAIVTSDDEAHERLTFLQNAVGAVPGPLDCFLVLRGLKTLAIRMEAHCRNAARVAEFLAEHPRVRDVYYPGLPTHPGHDVAMSQMSGFGGMVSFEMATEEEAFEVCRRTKLFFLAESLGGVESLIEHPGRMTHMSVAGSPLEVPATLVRLSVGIEHPDDLLEDLERALG